MQATRARACAVVRFLTLTTPSDDATMPTIFLRSSHHRPPAGVDYEIDLQGGKKSYQEGDFATRPLFKTLDPARLCICLRL